MNHKTIVEQFHTWRELTYPGIHLDPTGDQYKQLRFAFFGGASSLILEMLELATESDDHGMAALSRYMTEISGFLASEKESHKNG